MHLTDGGSSKGLFFQGRQLLLPARTQIFLQDFLNPQTRILKRCCVSGAEAPSAYLHLPAGHEVGTLTDALEDLLQLGVDEGIIWRNVGTFQNRALSVPPTIPAFCRVHSP